MSDKISIAFVETGDHLKHSLIYLILGKDVSNKCRCSSDINIHTYENDTFEVISVSTASKKIKSVLSPEKHCDMCLLAVEDGFEIPDVWQKIEKLHRITGKPTEDFTVVLPIRCKPEESYPFKSYAMEDLFSKLRELAERRNLMTTNKRFAEQLHTGENKSVRELTELFTDNKRLKGSQSDNTVNLVLLGMSGSGKSVSGNTILGWTKFESKASSMPVTTECQAAETLINGTRVRVIDTPDIFDDEIKSSVKNYHVTQCRQLCQSDRCVYLLVMHVSRFTDGERDILRKIEEAFGRRAKEQTIILLTRGEELQRADMNLGDFLKNCEPELKNIVKQCGGRCVVFENKTPQATALMQTVNRMLNK